MQSVLITGVGPKGLGAEAAKAIVKHQPALLIFASRTLSKIEAVTAEIKGIESNVPIRTLVVDLGSQASVRAAANEVLSYTENIDVLINNASIMASPWALTPEGIESQFGTNHIGTFLFTNLILPKIIAAGPGSRIVTVSSVGHRFSDIRFDDYNFQVKRTNKAISC